LPYQYGKIDYERDGLGGQVRAKNRSFLYRAELHGNEFATCQPESLTEFLLERYTAFTQSGLTKRFFRIWHQPWRQIPAEIEIMADDLIATSGNWWRAARCIGANYSPGVDVWMGWPHHVEKIL
jgi:uncharacterized protein